ncbi:MAG: FAD:protein FMN transferase [Paludibacter sp.]|jgi:thiamine biosynthesis lipoprotein|nr:FAD:protein FMN transferase [Bacteroidales bacterium]HOS46166.1 FAD:protein FMN transferase [Paludibacter sp.]
MNKICIFLSVFFLASCLTNTSQSPEYTKIGGRTFGTYYHITYLHPEGKNLQTEIESKLQEFDASLSAFNDQSIISKINRNEDVVVDDFFMQMYVEAVRVSQHTHGAFDITVAPLVNAWGFGFGEKERKETPDVAAILPYVGSQKISLQNQRIVKTDSRIMLDASAIAKGQAADVIGELLEAEGCKNFMVEIGGEISCRGLNPKGKKWQIGIDRPDEILLEEQRPLQTILSLTDCGMATSGNYRQYYYRDGKKYAHTINPITGYPVDHNLLSATVISSSSMRADAYATAFMVLGVDSSLAICNRLPDVACYLIAEGKDNNYEVYYSDGFSDYFSNP